MPKYSIITPAYKAQNFIIRSVKSVLEQSYDDWEMLIISDDLFDYQEHLRELFIEDPRIKHFSTGQIGSGASSARNLGLDNANGEYIAILDADDSFHPQKLEIYAKHLEKSSLIATAINIRNPASEVLGSVATSSTQGLKHSSDYMNTHFSMDSMIVFNREKLSHRYNKSLKCFNDFDFILQCFQSTQEFYNINQPLHNYYKQDESISNNPSSCKNYITAKSKILKEVERGSYKLDKKTKTSAINFLKTSIKAEKTFENELKSKNNVLFENIIKKLL